MLISKTLPLYLPFLSELLDEKFISREGLKRFPLQQG